MSERFSGYSLSFPDANYIFGAPERRDEVAEIVDRAGYGLRGEGSTTELLDRAGNPVDPELVHEAIQSQPDLQFALYQTWMDLSRRGY